MRHNRRPKWLQNKLKEVTSFGRLNLDGEYIEDLSIIGSITPLKTLNLAFTNITSLSGLSSQPNLDFLNIASTGIESFLNFAAVSSISKIFLANTPVSKQRNYKISLLLVCPGLRTIDGRIISDVVKSRVREYPKVAARLVNQGWFANYPCPSESVLKDLSQTYCVPFEEDEAADDFLTTISEGQDIEEIIQKYAQKHQEMLYRAEEELKAPIDASSSPKGEKTLERTEASVEIVVDSRLENEENEFGAPSLLSFRILDTLKRFGFAVGDEEKSTDEIIQTLEQVWALAEGQTAVLPVPEHVIDQNSSDSSDLTEPVDLDTEHMDMN
jgi:hypothetical protein